MRLLIFRDTVAAAGLLLLLAAVAVVGARPVQLPAAVAAMNSSAWQNAAALRLRHRHLQRYVVLPITADQQQPLNLGNDGTRIQGTAASVMTCQSHQPGLAAICLDDQPLESPVFDITGDFTIEGWFRWHGRGRAVGDNNGGAGTLLALGDGVHDGFSLSIAFEDGGLQFGLGRPAPKVSLVTRGRTRVAPGLWAHLAVVRTAEQVRLYLNGLLVGCGDTDVAAAQPADWRKLRVGYVGNGDSSVRMDVGEWAVFTAALTDRELAQLALLSDAPATGQSAVEMFKSAEVLRQQRQADAALTAFAATAESGTGYWQQAARLEAMVLQSGGEQNVAEAMRQWTVLNTAAERGSLPSRFTGEVLPVLRMHCAECHGAALWCQPASAGLADQLLSAGFWSEVQTRLVDRSMPPEGCPPLPIEQRRRVLYWIQQLPQPDPCEEQLTEERRRRLSPLAAVGRRLTRTEFSVALQQLLGVQPQPDLLPPPEGAGGEGFDTAAGTLIMSSSTAELFFSCVGEAVNRALDEQVAATADPPDHVPIRHVVRALSGAGTELDVALRRFVRLAWRRFPADADWQGLLSLRQQLLADGLTDRQAVASMLQAALLSPNFLYVLETPPQPPVDFRISPHEFAARMALFLWSGIPDEPLLQAADDDRLQTAEQIQQQVRRMLQHPLADQLGRSFGLQWLGVEQLQAVRKDEQRYPQYTRDIASLMQEEAWRTVAGVFRDDRPLVELLAADYVWANSQLAQYYGLSFPRGAVDWQRIPAGAASRGGVLTLGAVMVASSYPSRTSPVLRGRWVLDRILGQRVLPAPADVPALEKTVSAHPAMTLRQQMELHRDSPTCRGCHQAMDPLGFALEEFDAVGRWSTVRDGLAVDSAATLPDGTALQGSSGLRQEILRRQSQWLPHFVRKLTGYAAGRELFDSELCLLQDIEARTLAAGGTGSSLITAILLSDVFQLRRLVADSGKAVSE